MEGVALLLRHGIVGFLLYYVPFLAAAAVLLFQFFRRLKARMTDFTYCSLLFSAMMACATSLIAGHTLASPSVSLMVAILYGKLMVRTSAQNQALAQGTALPGEMCIRDSTTAVLDTECRCSGTTPAATAGHRRWGYPVAWRGTEPVYRLGFWEDCVAAAR